MKMDDKSYIEELEIQIRGLEQKINTLGNDVDIFIEYLTSKGLLKEYIKWYEEISGDVIA